MPVRTPVDVIFTARMAGIRDLKNPCGPALAFDVPKLSSFLTGVQQPR
jgi:hypothetical protein